MAGYAPDQRRRLQKATRFFARPSKFTLECPHCGVVYVCNSWYIDDRHWNPRTSEFHCNGKGGCSRAYVIGIVARSIRPGNNIVGKPRDQVPGPRELAQLRAEGGGWWMPPEDTQRYSTVHESNSTDEEERPDRDDEEETN